jgi:hypothetical protein
VATDALTAAVDAILWPYLRELGFGRVTARKFARRRNDVFQQVWVDANGRAGKQATCVIVCCNFPFGPVDGYPDPHGWRVGDRSWNTSSERGAGLAMTQALNALQHVELAKLDQLASIDSLLGSLAGYPDWLEVFTDQARRWRQGDVELAAQAIDCAVRLKLA